ncbi:hypothetical protein TNCV_2792051 [Trichonephila clavipes]|nr:hypothetical protein TNCV_2792051 [Trichonephila clavipes]
MAPDLHLGSYNEIMDFELGNGLFSPSTTSIRTDRTTFRVERTSFIVTVFTATLVIKRRHAVKVAHRMKKNTGVAPSHLFGRNLDLWALSLSIYPYLEVKRRMQGSFWHLLMSCELCILCDAMSSHCVTLVCVDAVI